MPAHFKSLPLFSSGPARFSVMSQGLVVLSNLSLGTTDPNTFPIGPRELDVVVTGRLVASSESALWTLREALTAQITYPPEPGLLEDSRGKQWANMSFIRIDWDTRTDHGRTHSISYAATFRRFAIL